MNKAQQLLGYKDRINTLEQEESMEKGKQQAQNEELLSDFHCKNIREANREFDKMDKEETKKEKEYKEQIKELARLFSN